MVEPFVFIDAAKVRNYLLDPDHPQGGSKARFFRSLGYSRLAWRRLESDLRRAHDSWRMRSESKSAFGDVYRLVSGITGPNGRFAVVVTVWIIREGESFARLVTAHPGKLR